MGNTSVEHVFTWLRRFGGALKGRRRAGVWIGRDGLIHVLEIYASPIALAELDEHFEALEAMTADDAEAHDDGAGG